MQRSPAYPRGWRSISIKVAKLNPGTRPAEKARQGGPKMGRSSVDTFSRFSPAIEPRFTLRGAHVVEVLERVGREMDSRQPFRSTWARSLCRAIWIFGLTSAVRPDRKALEKTQRVVQR